MKLSKSNLKSVCNQIKTQTQSRYQLFDQVGVGVKIQVWAHVANQVRIKVYNNILRISIR